jgi:hypothetical protein
MEGKDRNTFCELVFITRSRDRHRRSAPPRLRERRIVYHLKCKTGIVTGSNSGTGLAIAGHGKYAAKKKRRWDPSSITRNVRKNLHFIYASPPITIRDDG